MSSWLPRPLAAGRAEGREREPSGGLIQITSVAPSQDRGRRFWQIARISGPFDSATATATIAADRTRFTLLRARFGAGPRPCREQPCAPPRERPASARAD